MRRKACVDDGEEGDNEEEEEEEEREDAGSKRKRKGTASAGKQRPIRPRLGLSDRVKDADFKGQTLVVRGKNLICEACNKSLDWTKKSTLKTHCTGKEHIKAVRDYGRKKESKQVKMIRSSSTYSST